MVDKVRGFDNELNDFVAGQIPCWLVVSGFFRDEACVAWLRATSEKLENVLTELYDKHCTLPGAVLYMIAEEWHYIHQYKNRSQEEIDRLAPLEKTLNDNRGREINKSLKILKAAIVEVEKWKPMSWSLYKVDWSMPAVTDRFYSSINSQMMIEELNHLEHNVRQLGRTKPGRPQLTRLRKCARNLAAFFRRFIEGRPCHEYTATILARTSPPWRNGAAMTTSGS
jgi:hypothetical protein